jgi:hypothetical protein
MFLESHVELCENDPYEYIRRGLNGSDTDTQYKAFANLGRTLLEHFTTEVADIFLSRITEYLEVSNLLLLLNL